MNMTYYKLANSIVVQNQGKTYTLHKTDHRYPRLISAIDTKDYKEIENILDPTKVLDHEGFEVRNGLIYFKEQPIPTILGNQFLDFKLDKISFMAMVNFWFNLKNRADFEDSKEYIVNMLQHKGYPVTEDGMIIVYKQDENDKEVRFDTTKKVITPFFNYSKLTAQFRDLFDQRKSLSDIIQEVFGFNSKKLMKLVIERAFQNGTPYVQEQIFRLGVAFKGLLNPNNLFTVIENNYLQSSYGTITQHRDLHEFLIAYGKSENGNHSEKKIMNLLAQKSRGEIIFEIAGFYNQLIRNNIDVDFKVIDLAANMNKIHEYLQREVNKLEHPMFDLDLHLSFPEEIKAEGLEVNKLKLVYPKDNYQLIEWSQKLKNCLYDYGKRCKNGEVLIVGFKDEDDRMIYALEVIKGEVTQFRKYDNKAPREEDFVPVLEALERHRVIHSMIIKDGVCAALKNKFGL